MSLGVKIERTALAVIAACAVILTVLSVLSFVERTGGPTPAGPAVAEWRDLLDESKAITDLGGDVEVVVFSDYTCRFCVDFFRMLEVLEAAHPGRMTVFKRHFPLAPGLQTDAAVASECARAQGRFRQYSAALFTHQDRIAAGRLADLAGPAGVPDTRAFAECLDRRDPAEVVATDRARGLHLGVRTTPTFIIDGRLISGLPPMEFFDDLLGSASD